MGRKKSEDEPRTCGTRTKAGHPCKKPAGAGTDHLGWGKCKQHGGNSPALRTHAAREETEAMLSELKMSSHVNIDPDELLIQEVHRTAGVVRYLDQLVSTIETDDLIVLTELGFRPRAWIDVYQRERAHLVKVTSAALHAGVAERQVRLAEVYGAQVAMLVQAVLVRLELSPDQRKLAPVIVREEMRKLGNEEDA